MGKTVIIKPNVTPTKANNIFNRVCIFFILPSHNSYINNAAINVNESDNFGAGFKKIKELLNPFVLANHDDSKNFTGRNHKWDNMLFKLFDHSVDENLPHSGEDRKNKKVSGQLGMFVIEIDCQFELP